MKKPIKTAIVVLGCALVPVAPVDAGAVEHVVTMQQGTFKPQALTINVGDTVKWVNNDPLVHTSTSGAPCSQDGKWNSGDMLPGASFTRQFNSEGSLQYYCIYHCLIGMTGSVTVDSAVPVTSTTWGAVKALFKVELDRSR